MPAAPSASRPMLGGTLRRKCCCIDCKSDAFHLLKLKLKLCNCLARPASIFEGIVRHPGTNREGVVYAAVEKWVGVRCCKLILTMLTLGFSLKRQAQLREFANPLMRCFDTIREDNRALP